MLSAHDFAKMLPSTEGFGFSIDGPRMVAKLREIADDIETAEKQACAVPRPLRFVIQSVIVESKADCTDFTSTRLIIEFTERAKP